MQRIRRIVNPALPWFDRRVDWRVDRAMDARLQKFAERYAPRENLDAVAGDVAEFNRGMAELLFTMKELRRWMVDNLDAAADTATLFGEGLARLQTSVDRLAGELERMGGRLDALESSSR